MEQFKTLSYYLEKRHMQPQTFSSSGTIITSLIAHILRD